MINKIVSELKKVADPKRQESSKTMFLTSMEYLGVRNPDIKILLKSWRNEFKNWSPKDLIHFAKELVKTRIFECNYAAFEILWRNKNAMQLLRLEDLEILGQNMDNWATTDTFSMLLSGHAWRNNQITDRDVLDWLNSGNVWWRRAAIVSTVGMNLKSRGGTGDTKRTLMICEKVIADRDDRIVKALSWTLRELSKSDSQAVKNFMTKYEPQLAGRVKR